MAYDSTAPNRHGPVRDWAADWDGLDDDWGRRAPEIWQDLRASGCPMAFTERYGRAWMPLHHETVSQIAHDTEHFSSFRVSVSLPDSPVRKAPPITSDPPEHHAHRRLLLPPFNAARIAALVQPTREYCRSLIAGLDGRDLADAAKDYAQHIPVHVIAEMIGVPESDAEVFRDWVHRNFQEAPRDNAAKLQLQKEMVAYFEALLAERAADPRDDLATLVGGAEVDGAPLSLDEQVGYLILLILAGIDTTWSGIGSGLWHFAQHPEQRRRLAAASFDDPLWIMAMEEVLRFYAPVTMARQVVADTEVAGCPVHKGDQVLLTFPAANRDPAEFDRAGEFVLDRAVNRHAAFGLGIHRCLGSNLARMELLVAFQEWISAFPDYHLDEGDRGVTTWANGQVRGPRAIPVRLR
ncbi:MAG: cytochrome P450 [Acidimicrobiales bacterium]|nr:cytochrome P450 [Acidimicrobiales bacterium]